MRWLIDVSTAGSGTVGNGHAVGSDAAGPAASAPAVVIGAAVLGWLWGWSQCTQSGEVMPCATVLPSASIAETRLMSRLRMGRPSFVGGTFAPGGISIIIASMAESGTGAPKKPASATGARTVV